MFPQGMDYPFTLDIKDVKGPACEELKTLLILNKSGISLYGVNPPEADDFPRDYPVFN